jgi:hypothetical protein
MRMKPVVVVILTLGVATVIIAICTRMFVWDGGFGQVEYQLTFIGDDGKPIEGVQLQVESQNGTNYFHYPVTDYIDGVTPTSNNEGVLTFHHVGDGVEFGGGCWELFGFAFGECKGPVFELRFMLDGREIHRCKFNDLNALAGRDRVTRTWIRTEWLPPCQTGESLMELFARENDNRDKDQNGKTDMAERAALNAIASLVENALNVERGSIGRSEELEFLVFQQTTELK